MKTQGAPARCDGCKKKRDLTQRMDMPGVHPKGAQEPRAAWLCDACQGKKKAKRKPAPDFWIIATMESETCHWLAAGRTKEEALQALKKKWDAVVVPKGGRKWDSFTKDDGESCFDYYGGRIQQVLPGKAYLDGEDERGWV